MSERTSPEEDADPGVIDDPDDGSTWSTIDGTAELDDLMNEDELDDFLVEPIPNPLANQGGPGGAAQGR